MHPSAEPLRPTEAAEHTLADVPADWHELWAQMVAVRAGRPPLRKGRHAVGFDADFRAVMAACAAVRRPGQDGTWIDDAMLESYVRLHELGWAHSVEVREDGELVGGLYGLAIGRMFYGESMFSRRSDASKIAFAHLVRYLLANEFGMVDCQMRTAHLASLGAREISRTDFLARLHDLTRGPHVRQRWTCHGLDPDW